MPFSTLFVPHGGGPLPLLEHVPHQSLIRFLQAVPQQLIQPDVIVVVTAHWEAAPVEISTAAMPSMLFDYYGFPAESYELSYPAPGAPELGHSLVTALNEQGLPARENAERGYDHGTFVPLMLMFPNADIPVLQVSLNANLDAAEHVRYGKALGSVLPENTLVLGSGLSFHNLKSQFANMDNAHSASEESRQFDTWLAQSLTLPADDALERLENWTQAPHARYCHPREEHLLPLHVCAGVAAARGQTIERLYSDVLMGHLVSAFAG